MQATELEVRTCQITTPESYYPLFILRFLIEGTESKLSLPPLSLSDNNISTVEAFILFYIYIYIN